MKMKAITTKEKHSEAPPKHFFSRESRLLILYLCASVLVFVGFAYSELQPEKDKYFRQQKMYAANSNTAVKTTKKVPNQSPVRLPEGQTAAHSISIKKNKSTLHNPVKKVRKSKQETQQTSSEGSLRHKKSVDKERQEQKVVALLPKIRLKEVYSTDTGNSQNLADLNVNIDSRIEKITRIEQIEPKRLKELLTGEIQKKSFSELKKMAQPIEEEIHITFKDEDDEPQPISKQSLVSREQIENYSVTDFDWHQKNNNFKTQAAFENTMDGLISYALVNSGTLFRLNDLSELDISQGVFIEKSEDGETFTSIGIINTAKKENLLFADTELSYSKKTYYKFRGTDLEGNEKHFGELTVLQDRRFLPTDIQIINGQYLQLTLESISQQVIECQLTEAKTGQQITDYKEIEGGTNRLKFTLSGASGLYFLELSAGEQCLEFLVHKEAQESRNYYYNEQASNFPRAMFTSLKTVKDTRLQFDYFLEKGRTAIFNKVTYKNKEWQIQDSKIEMLPQMDGGRSNGQFWLKTKPSLSYAQQEVAVLLKNEDKFIPTKLNIFAAKDMAKPLSICKDKKLYVPGLKTCPNTSIMIFNPWGNVVHQEEMIKQDELNLGRLEAGMYYVVVGNSGFWIKLDEN